MDLLSVIHLDKYIEDVDDNVECRNCDNEEVA